MVRAISALVAAVEERPVRRGDLAADLAHERDAGLAELAPFLLHLLALVVRERGEIVAEIAVAGVLPVKLDAFADRHAGRRCEGRLLRRKKQHVKRRR